MHACLILLYSVCTFLFFRCHNTVLSGVLEFPPPPPSRPPSARTTLKQRMAVFTLEDEQIVWMDKSSQTDKSSDVRTERTNFLTNKSSDIWPCGKMISQTICPSRRTSRRQYGINSHQTDKCQTICSFSSVKTANGVCL